MEVESFEDEGIAKLLNDWFVSIKVSLICEAHTVAGFNYLLSKLASVINFQNNILFLFLLVSIVPFV